MWVGHARMFYQIEGPAVSAFFHFGPVIPTFVEQRACPVAQPGRREVEQVGKRGQCPGGDDFRRGHKRIAVVDAPRHDPGGQAELHVWSGAFHSFDEWVPKAEISRAAHRARVSWLRRILAPAGGGDLR